MFHKPRFLEQAALAVVLISFSFTGVAQSKTKAYTADELAMMSNADSNGDGSVSREELEKAMSEMMKRFQQGGGAGGGGRGQ